MARRFATITVRTACVLHTYRRILTLPGAVLFSSTGLVARLPISMVGLGVVLLVSQRSGSYGLAGSVAAAYVLAGAVGAPVQGRLTDRLGQSRVLPLAAGFSVTGLACMLVAIGLDAQVPVPHVFAALAGAASPQIGSMVRARWSHVTPDRAVLQTAFALEAVVDEAVFVIGPVLVTVLATTWNPYAGLVFAGAAGLFGSLLLAAQRRTEPAASPPRRDGEARTPLNWPALWPLVVAATGFGTLFGAAEVVTVAFATEHGHRSLSGPLLAVWAAGSLGAGLLIGARAPRAGVLTQLRVAATLLSVSFVPMLLTSSLVVLGGCLLVSGLAISPGLVASISLLERAVPSGRLTEGMSWFTTGVAGGLAPGSALSGWVVDERGAAAGYAVCLLAGAVAAAVAWSVRPSRFGL